MRTCAVRRDTNLESCARACFLPPSLSFSYFFKVKVTRSREEALHNATNLEICVENHVSPRRPTTATRVVAMVCVESGRDITFRRVTCGAEIVRVEERARLIFTDIRLSATLLNISRGVIDRENTKNVIYMFVRLRYQLHAYRISKSVSIAAMFFRRSGIEPFCRIERRAGSRVTVDNTPNISRLRSSRGFHFASIARALAQTNQQTNKRTNKRDISTRQLARSRLRRDCIDVTPTYNQHPRRYDPILRE